MKNKNKHLIMNGFLLFILLIGCKSNELKTHLLALNKINSHIDLGDWKLIQKIEYNTYNEEFVLEKLINDTSYILCFSYLKEDSISYYIQRFIKSYSSKGFYYEMSLSENDTLYFFKFKKTNKMEKPGFYTDINLLDFSFGKYYYMHEHSMLNMGQDDYFEKHKDSLIKVKGNNILELPDLRLKNKRDDTIIPIENIEDTPIHYIK